MNVASLELSKELHELSGWTETCHYWVQPTLDAPTVEHGATGNDVICPAYDLGYLIRKLPPSIKIELSKRVYYDDDDHWSVDLTVWYGDDFFMTDDFRSNEDAIASLAIELLKQGVLKKENN